jgi:hypothetical protein
MPAYRVSCSNILCKTLLQDVLRLRNASYAAISCIRRLCKTSYACVTRTCMARYESVQCFLMRKMFMAALRHFKRPKTLHKTP